MILVCGGAGYIGSHAVVELLARGEKVVVVDNLSTGHEEAVPDGAAFCRGDLRDRAFLANVLSSHPVRGVMHFAACSQVGDSMKNPLEYYHNNVEGTRVLLDAMLKADVSHLVFSSSAAVYGEPARVPITEDAPLKPTNPYGATKKAIEELLHWTRAAHGLQFVALRYFNVAGASGPSMGEDHRPETHLIPLVLDVALNKRQTISIFGDDYNTRDGTCVRDYIHVGDLVEAHVRALEWLRQGGGEGYFNLGNGNGFTVREVVRSARRVTGHPIPVEVSGRRPGDPATLVAASDRARLELGWLPRVTELDAIVRSAWVWHRAHPRGFGDAPQ